MEAVEVDTLQGVGDDFLLHHAKYVPVQSIRCPGAFPRDPDMQYQRHVWAGKSQHTPQCTVLYSEGLSTFAEVQSHLAQGSHGRGVHQPGQAIKIAITKVTGMHRVYSNSRNPSLGELQIGVAEDPPTKLTCCRGAGAGHFVRNSWIPVLGSSRSLRRYLSRCIWESIASGTRT